METETTMMNEYNSVMVLSTLVLGLIFGLGGYLIWRFRTRQWQLKNALHLERIRRKEIEALNQTKLDFFTNISHELRTPLTLILGPLEQLLASHNLPVKEREQIRLIHRNTEKLERLISQLLDFTKIGSGKMTIQPKRVDIIQLVREVIEPFSDFAKRYGVSFNATSTVPTLEMEVDVEKVDKILYNLLSNAFKFTPKGGEVEMCLGVSQFNKPNSTPTFDLRISDTGIGIPDHQQKHIFERFYQVSQEKRMKQSGTGIGLALTKDLVELHGGTLTLESQEGIGSTFFIQFPLSDTYEQKTLSHSRLVLAEVKDPTQPNGKSKSVVFSKLKMPNSQKPKALVIEDDPEVSHFITQCLESKFQVETAADGIAGLLLATQMAPEIIISDVVMPKMGGLELCAKLKTDIHTSHIPIILLTARTSFEFQLEGLKIGADDYLMKPFSPQLLMARIENLIQARARLRSKFGELLEIDPAALTHSSSDERFFQQLLSIVSERMPDPEFSVKELASVTGMSHSVLYRKIKALTGFTAKEFIVNLRLKKAAKLLKTQEMAVSEVAFAVGFNDPRYFSTVFRKYFDMSPTQFLSSPALNKENN